MRRICKHRGGEETARAGRSANYVIADNLGKKKVVQHGKKTSSSAETLKCFVYQKTAHLAKDCPDIKKTKNETALAILDENDLESEEDDALEKISIPFGSLATWY
jgi:hypothetical protein